MSDSDGFPTAQRPMPIACTLPADRIADQLGEWAALRASVTASEPIDRGVRLTIPVTNEAAARDLAAREQTCCSFLSIDVHTRGEHCLIDITSTHPDAGPVIAVISGSTH